MADSSLMTHAYFGVMTQGLNMVIFVSFLCALGLGMLVGYERSYHGHAAGIRTFGLISLASCAVIVICGHPSAWYGGSTQVGATDPTRVIQGILAGVGFIGVGVIHRDGYKTSGLTTAAAIWTCSAIGIMVGVGFYFAAFLLTILSSLCMSIIPYIERRLPAPQSYAVTLRFKEGVQVKEEVLKRAANRRGYRITQESIIVSHRDGHQKWQFVAITDRGKSTSITEIATELAAIEGVIEYEFANARR
jgi:putative Mg2+ transporter-C (MgtC) family protein